MTRRPPLALYVHVPFCLSTCPYCDFVVYAGTDARGPRRRVEAFVSALSMELELLADALDATFGTARPPMRSVYLGGGTPSLLDVHQVAGLLTRVEHRFGLAHDAEITLEANPGAAERGDLRGFRAAGISRVSLGAQSLDPAELRRLGRRHSPSDVVAAVREARAAGFAHLNLDLLYDVPGQTLGSWCRTLGAVLALEPEHVSSYALALDDPDAEGLTGPLGDHLPVRPGARAWRRRARAEQDQDRAADMYAVACARLAEAGLVGYELSNWALPGHESRHDLTYWRHEPYEAVGPGAHAFDGAATRRWNAARLDAYLAALAPADGSPPRLPPGGEERLDAAMARAEGVILGLRLAEGVDAEVVEDPAFADPLGWAIGEGLAVREVDAAGHPARVRLTERGRMLSNEVFMRLLPDPSGTAASPAERPAA